MRRILRRCLIIGVLLGGAFFLLPVVSFDSPHSSLIMDSAGEVLGATVAADEQWRFSGTGSVPERYAIAVCHYEDRRFHSHPGVDPIAVVRAIGLNVRRGRVVSGASTITMQVVRLSRGNPPRTLAEKGWEALLALRLEAARSKAEILALYADNAPFGGNTVGLGAAAYRYFGRSPADLTWAEAATLAVLPNSPGLIHPGRNRDRLRAKRDTLLDSLAIEGVVSEAELRSAKAESLPEVLQDVPHDAPHLLAHAAGTRIDTTLDGDLQRRAAAVLERHRQVNVGLGVHNGAAVIVELETGYTVAYIGNVALSHSPGSHVDVVTAPRSTGSLLKPFLYAAMLGEGQLLPRQLVTDVPSRFGAFTPANFDHKFAGALPAASALARSRNVPAVTMLRDYGVERFTVLLRRLGMTTLVRNADQYGLSLIIGGGEGSLWEMVGLYRDLALTVTHADGTLPPAMRWRRGPPGEERRATLDSGAAWLTLQALVEVNRPGVESEWRHFRGAEAVAWKTGTSQGFRDAWAIGVTPTHAIGVWIGNADGEGRPQLTGFTLAAPVLFDLFDLVSSRGAFKPPVGALVPVRVCAHSGALAGPDCADTAIEEVPRAGQRGPSCTSCKVIHCDAGCAHRVTSECSDIAAMETRSWFSLHPAAEWYYARQNPEYRPLPPLREDCRGGATEAAPMAILSPAPSAEVLVPIELSGQRGRVVFEASHRDPRAELFWHLDDAFVGVTTAPHQLALAPQPGHHRLTLVDVDGARVERSFRVISSSRP